MRILALAFVLSFLGAPLGPASAGAAACHLHTLSEVPFLCGYTFSRASLGGTDSTLSGTEFFNMDGGVADNTSAGDGGLSGIARVDVDWGVVRAYSHADNGSYTETDLLNAEARDISSGEGAFADAGTLVSPTFPPGTPVEITVTMDPAGAFTDGAGAQIDLTLENVGGLGGVTKQALLNDPSHSSFVPPPFPLSGFVVGDQLAFTYQVRNDAGTTNRVSPARVMATADMEHTARLFIDIETPGVTLDTMSGHDYTTVPEPSETLLLGVAACVLAWRGRRGIP
jgi:PEP-CTERM motif